VHACDAPTLAGQHNEDRRRLRRWTLSFSMHGARAAAVVHATGRCSRGGRWAVVGRRAPTLCACGCACGCACRQVAGRFAHMQRRSAARQERRIAAGGPRACAAALAV